MNRMDNESMLLTQIKGNSICIAPFMNTSAAKMHLPLYFLVLCEAFISFEHCEIISEFVV